MKKVKGTFSFNIWIKCPFCGIDIEAEELTADEEYPIGCLVLGGKNKPGIWEDIGYILYCPACKDEFILDSINI